MYGSKFPFPTIPAESELWTATAAAERAKRPRGIRTVNMATVVQFWGCMIAMAGKKSEKSSDGGRRSRSEAGEADN